MIQHGEGRVLAVLTLSEPGFMLGDVKCPIQYFKRSFPKESNKAKANTSAAGPAASQ